MPTLTRWAPVSAGELEEIVTLSDIAHLGRLRIAPSEPILPIPGVGVWRGLRLLAVQGPGQHFYPGGRGGT